MPFNMETPIGYGAMFTIEMCLVLCGCHTSNCALGFVIGSNIVMTSFGQDIQNKVFILNNPNQSNAKGSFYDIIRLHSEVKQLSIFWSTSYRCEDYHELITD